MCFCQTSKSRFPHNRPPATRLRQCSSVSGLITNVFGQQPVPSRCFLFGLTWRGDFARILRFFIIALWSTESKLRISVTSESNLQAVESKPAPVSSNLHASFVTSTSTESKHRISVTSILHASPSHPPPRNPSFAFRPLQPPSTSNWRRSMRSKSHHLRVIHVCCEQWSRMRARARTNLLQMRCNCQVRAGARFQ